MRRRILITIAIVAAASVAAFFVPSAIAIRSRIQRSELLELQREASIVATEIATAGVVDLESIEADINQHHDLAVYDTAGNLVAGQGPPRADSIVRVGTGGAFAEGYVGGDLVAAVPVRTLPDGSVVVVRIREPQWVSRNKVVKSFGLLGIEAAVVIAAAIGIGALLARRLSRPVEDLGAWTRALGNRARRDPPVHSGITELDQLGDTMVDADERIRELLQRERSFSSHVAHQLRTPVAALRVAIEAELDAPRPDPTSVLYESLSAVDRLESTISSMLALARHDERTPAWCDVTRLVTEHTDRWMPMFAAAGRDLSARGSIVAGLIDPATVRHVLDVLLDNALAHGHGGVSVRIGSSNGQIEVDVADEGHTNRRVDPFSEQRSDSGHGIGLRLARTLAESDGGELSLVESASTVFRLTLPVDPQGKPVSEDA